MEYPIAPRRSTEETMSSRLALLVAAALALSACRSGDETASATPAGTATVEAVASATPVPNGSRVSGRVSIDGTAPPRVVRTVNADPALCGTEPVVDREMVVDPATKGVRYAVVTLTNDTSGAAIPAAPVTREIEQAKCEYFPYVTVLPRGSRAIVRNADDGLHDVRVLPESGPDPGGNHALRPDGQVELTFADAGRVRLACDLHYWARAWVIVDDAPFAAVTDAQGHYAFEGVPAGTWRLTVWHERLGTTVRDVTVGPAATTEDVALPPPLPSRPKPR